MTENRYAHFLYNIPGLGNRGIYSILESNVSCEDIFKMDEKSLGILIKEKTSKVKIAKEVIERRKFWNFEEEEKKLKDKGIRFISVFSDEFPEKLKNIPDPPFGIYVKGNLPNSELPSVAIVGARMCSDYGRFMSREFGKGLALAGVQVISGMARGVDGISQKAAIEAGGSSFGILGCGVDICYPAENRDVYSSISVSGGLISEYHPGTEPKPNLFPMRNRIISALADIVLVVEARQKSGTQITVDQALEQGKEVLAVPGRVTDRLSDGCNFLISQGAGVALSVEDVLDRLWSGGVPGKYDDKAKTKANSNDCVEMLEKTQNNTEECFDLEEPGSIDDEIVGVVDIIPVSASSIMERLYEKGITTSVSELMGKLMDLTYKGRIIQDGVYYRKRAR
ncbi:DNA processing protein [Butyrivibrio proteoclasticus]|uniref:DNA processing protein n=1 Tax=Butyrivibrio proteoclasticus TaxID=43305 RepID=A0A1I5RJM9_9FIRM|nr:DNA-processing protein DprA [Butyrivibrio proteoclasticus]SFP58774.1 DNA processing protein [Butyrivibrio proteoclasticus]